MLLLDNQYISMSDLQKNTKKCIWDIDDYSVKMIMSNNKPKAVLLSLNEYEYLVNESKKIKELELDDWEKKAIRKYEERKANNKTEYTEVTDDYFNQLK